MRSCKRSQPWPTVRSETAYRVAVNVKETCDRADRESFRERADNLSLLVKMGERSLSAPYVDLPGERSDNELASFDASAVPDALKSRPARVLLARHAGRFIGKRSTILYRCAAELQR